MSTELLISILTRELPFDGSPLRVSVGLPCVDFAPQQFDGGDSTIPALTTEDSNLDLCHVQTARMFGCVVEGHTAQGCPGGFRQPSCNRVGSPPSTESGTRRRSPPGSARWSSKLLRKKTTKSSNSP